MKIFTKQHQEAFIKQTFPYASIRFVAKVNSYLVINGERNIALGMTDFLTKTCAHSEIEECTYDGVGLPDCPTRDMTQEEYDEGVSNWKDWVQSELKSFPIGGKYFAIDNTFVDEVGPKLVVAEIANYTKDVDEQIMYYCRVYPFLKADREKAKKHSGEDHAHARNFYRTELFDTFQDLSKSLTSSMTGAQGEAPVTPE